MILVKSVRIVSVIRYLHIFIMTHSLPVVYWIPKRYLVTGLMFLGFFITYTQRACTSIALIDMTANSSITIGNRTVIIPGEFNYWTNEQTGDITSVFGVGLFFTCFLGSMVINLGGVTAFGIAVGAQGIISILLPSLLRIHLYLFMFGRAMQGLLLGMAELGVVDALTHWAPTHERARLASWYYLGATTGVALNYPMFGYVAHYLRWRAIFYIAGSFAILWSCTWLFFVGNNPSNDKYISEKERLYLMNSNVGVLDEKLDIPWKSIFTSRQVLAFVNEYFVAMWTSSFILYSVSTYIDNLYKISVAQIGVLASMPMYGEMVGLPIMAVIADILRKTGVSTRRIHKTFICTSHILCMLFLLTAALQADFIRSIICFALVRVSHSIAESSYCVLPMEIAGQYASIVKSISITVGCISEVLSPALMGRITRNKTHSSWNIYFFYLCCTMLYGLISFAIFGSGELEPWAIHQKCVAKNEIKKSDPVPIYSIEDNLHFEENQ